MLPSRERPEDERTSDVVDDIFIAYQSLLSFYFSLNSLPLAR